MRSQLCVVPVLALLVTACVERPEATDLAIATSALPQATIAVPYDATLEAIGGSPPYTWYVEASPAELRWLTVDPATGKIGGKPPTKVMPGMDITFRATDAMARTTTRTLDLTVLMCNQPGATIPCFTYDPARAQCIQSTARCLTDGTYESCIGGTGSRAPENCGPGEGDACGTCSAAAADGCDVTCMCGAGPSCSDPTPTCCGGICRDTQSDPLACGSTCTACPVPANGIATCQDGACGFACNSSYARCDGGCVPESASRCGASCVACDPLFADTCTAGACRCGGGAPCSGGTTCCPQAGGSVCVNTQTDVNHCGSCSPCPTFTAEQLSALHMTGVTCEGGRCKAQCVSTSSYRDCDGDVANGCEADLLWDTNNCGQCGNVCPYYYGPGACNGCGQCNRSC